MTLKVLVVEDNPMIAAMLRDALASVALVESASDAADALLRTVDEAPDLIVSDYLMPGMNGLQLLEKLKTRPATAKIPFILLASKSDIVERLKPFEEEVADIIAKPFFLKDAMLRIRRVLDRIALQKMARESAGGATVHGSLSQMNVIDLLQSLEMGRKTCVLTLTSGDQHCDLFFHEGQISHAVCGALVGDEAVYKALAWSDNGGFDINFETQNTEQSTTRSTQGLLMEGLRLLDEANRDD